MAAPPPTSVRRVTPAELAAASSNPLGIRNVCVLAHVDHGKTTFSDGLVASNAIIGLRSAGAVRYLDSTEEEQARGITMKSSSIALLHTGEPYRERRAAGGAGGDPVVYLVNLIDSPGHVDFSVDVSTAARLVDGAIVLVDAVEGVCIQTHAVLRTAASEGLTPLLVINKVDRLISELRLSPSEAYSHLCRTIEQVNVIRSELYVGEKMAEMGREVEEEKSGGAASSPLSDTHTFDAVALDIDAAEEAHHLFDPARGNVLFASAVDGWACSVRDFCAPATADKLGLPHASLRAAMWGDYYIKTGADGSRRILKGAAAAKAKPLAVALMLDRLWAVYEAGHLAPDEARWATGCQSGMLGGAGVA